MEEMLTKTVFLLKMSNIQLKYAFQIFFRIYLFLNLRKTNFLSISVLLSEIVTLLTKKRSFQWISPKMLQITEKLSLAVCGSFWGEKQFLYLTHFTALYKTVVYKKSKFSSGFVLFQTCWEKKNFEVFLSFFLRWSLFGLKREFFVDFPENASKQQGSIV